MEEEKSKREKNKNKKKIHNAKREKLERDNGMKKEKHGSGVDVQIK